MKLTKIHSDSCDICVALGSKAKALADENGFEYEEIPLEFFASNISPMRDYVVNYHVSQADGMIDLPLYIITTDKGEVQGSSAVESLKEVKNLIYSWNKWASSPKPSSAD